MMFKTELILYIDRFIIKKLQISIQNFMVNQKYIFKTILVLIY